MPHVRVLRPFNNGAHHAFVRPGDLLTVTEQRASDLERNGLVERVDGSKVAPVPANNMAPLPSNKALVPAVRRGRPAGSKTGARGR